MENIISMKRKLSKKAVAIALGKVAFVGFAIYGAVAGYNNFTAFSVRSYNSFIVKEAEARNIVKVETKTQYVVDPEKAAEAVSNAAQEGAKKGADESIRANLGK